MEERETNITLEEFGNLLREERVRCGYTVDEVASRLKITARVVRAIEDGDMDSMPHAVYARGFIRAYARILGISEEEVRPVCALLRDADEEQTQEPLLVPPRGSRNSGGGFWLAVLVGCAVLLGGGWYFREELPLDFFTNMLESSDRQATPAAPKLPPEEQAVPAPSGQSIPPQLGNSGQSGQAPEPIAPQTSGAATEQKTVAFSGTSEATPAFPAQGVTQNNEATPVRVSGFSSLPGTEAAPTVEIDNNLTLQNGSATPTNITANTSGRKHQIILTALAECWVHSTADGTDTRQLSIQKGETFALSFDRKLVVKLGNAGGVRIKYDGNELPPAGNSGQVKTLTFPLQDAQN